MRPPGPVPATVVRSTPRSRASFRTAGAAFGRPMLVAPTEGPAPPGASSRTTRIWPTFTMSPGTKARETTWPATGEGSSTRALSVWTSTRGWSRTTVSPGPTSQETISPSSRPSPTSGRRNSTLATRPSRPLGGRRPAGPSGPLAADAQGGGGDPGGVGDVVLFQHPDGVGDVVAGDPGHRGLQRVEGLLADGGHDLGGETGRLGGLGDDDGPAGLLHRGHDGLDV